MTLFENEEEQYNLKISSLLCDTGYIEKSSPIELTNIYDFFYKILAARYIVGNDDFKNLEGIKCLAYINIKENGNENHIPLLYAVVYSRTSNVSESVWEFSGYLQSIFGTDDLIIIFAIGDKIIFSFTTLYIDDNYPKVYLSDFIDLFDEEVYDLALNNILCADAFSSVENFIFSFGRDYYGLGTRNDIYNMIINTELMYMEELPFSTRKEIINDRANKYLESLTKEKYGEEFLPFIEFHSEGYSISRGSLDFDILEYELDNNNKDEVENSNCYVEDSNDFDYLDNDIFASADSLLNWIENENKSNKFLQSLTNIQEHYLFCIYNDQSIDKIFKLDNMYNCDYHNIIDQINEVSNIFYEIDVIEYDNDVPFIVFDYVDIIGDQFEEINNDYCQST